MNTGSRNEQLVGFDISYILLPHAQGHQGQTRVKLYSIVGQEAAQDLGNGVPAEEALGPDLNERQEVAAKQLRGQWWRGAAHPDPAATRRHGEQETRGRGREHDAGSEPEGQLWQQGARGGRGRGRGLHPHDQVQKRVHVSTCILTCR